MNTTDQPRTTEFREWRLRQGLTYRKAAELLGITHQAVHYLDRGDCQPKRGTRMLMDAIAKGYQPVAWTA